MITFLTPSYLYLHKIRVKRALAKYALIYEVPIPDPGRSPGSKRGGECWIKACAIKWPNFVRILVVSQNDVVLKLHHRGCHAYQSLS